MTSPLPSEERLLTAMRGGKPDRVPTAPLVHYFAAACAGLTCADLWWSRDKYRAAMRKCFDLVGPWDASYLLDAVSPEAYTWMVPMKMRVPGRELPADSPAQFLEACKTEAPSVKPLLMAHTECFIYHPG